MPCLAVAVLWRGWQVPLGSSLPVTTKGCGWSEQPTFAPAFAPQIKENKSVALQGLCAHRALCLTAFPAALCLCSHSKQDTGDPGMSMPSHLAPGHTPWAGIMDGDTGGNAVSEWESAYPGWVGGHHLPAAPGAVLGSHRSPSIRSCFP